MLFIQNDTKSDLSAADENFVGEGNENIIWHSWASQCLESKSKVSSFTGIAENDFICWLSYNSFLQWNTWSLDV